MKKNRKLDEQRGFFRPDEVTGPDAVKGQVQVVMKPMSEAEVPNNSVYLP